VDDVFGLACGEGYSDRAGGVLRVFLDGAEIGRERGEILPRFFAERVVAEAACDDSAIAEPGRHYGEISGRSAELLALGQHVPKQLS
jgi:hypothetical protein